MKKEKIKLKLGDKVYYVNDYGKKEHLIVKGYEGYTIKRFEDDGCRVTKIERAVKYKTIYEIPKPILDKQEKEYLEAVIRPFKSKVKYIIKKPHSLLSCDQFIAISLGEDSACLPNFEEGTMYKGMELLKRYTLAELGLFEEE